MRNRPIMDPIRTDGAPGASDTAVLRGMLKEHRFSDVLMAGEALLTRMPELRDVRLLVAVAHRFLGGIAAAMNTLETLERHHPGFSRLHEERGHCFVVMKQASQAIEAFLRAVSINHALPSSWGMLEGLYRMIGRSDDAARAAGQVATLKNLPQEVVTATGLFLDGDLGPAESLIRAFLLKHGDHVEGMRLLARIGMAHKVFDDAEILLAAVLERAPGYRAARREYADVLVELHKYPEARRQLDRLLTEEPANPVFKQLYATVAAGLGEHERAIGLYQELLTGTARDADLHLYIAHARKTLGRRAEAVVSYRRAAACREDFGDAYWSLANLKTYRFTGAELERMRNAESSPATGPVDRYHLCFALGKAWEDAGEYAESFRYYQKGNALKRSESRYRADIIETNTRQQIEVCTPEFFAARRGWGAQNPDPIFIVGLPRSGSTLIEQILASHSEVEGTQELANVQQIVGALRGRDPDLNDPRYPRILPQMQSEDFLKLGEQYIEGTRIYRGGKPGVGGTPGGVPFFIDKMPNNFRHVGLIHLMLPNARIIDARREPMACCFSNFKQLFAQGQEFTYGIEDIARYYRTYLELMRHWDLALPGRILRVHHEDVVDDLEGAVRRILDFSGLAFEPQCLEFHKTGRSIRTASSEQVRLPLFRDGLDQWKHFEPHLESLEKALGDALDRWRE
jgi:tetratricopeptide (TPR) repeat protein